MLSTARLRETPTLTRRCQPPFMTDKGTKDAVSDGDAETASVPGGAAKTAAETLIQHRYQEDIGKLG